MDKIRTQEDFIAKLNEIGNMFGVNFLINDDEVFIIDSEGRKRLMDKNGNFYSSSIDGKKICMRYIFAPHCFSTSVLIEVFVNDGKKRECCRIEQELRPQTGIREYPEFTYNSYHDGLTHLFYSNAFLVETCISNGANMHIYIKQ